MTKNFQLYSYTTEHYGFKCVCGQSFQEGFFNLRHEFGSKGIDKVTVSYDCGSCEKSRTLVGPSDDKLKLVSEVPLKREIPSLFLHIKRPKRARKTR